MSVEVGQILQTRVAQSNFSESRNVYNDTSPHLKEKKGDSIFSYYNIENEVDFLTQNHFDRITGEYYVRENVMRFLSEFVGKVPYTKITYEIKNGRLYYPGLDNPLDVYKKTAFITGDDSREWAEAIGFEKVEESVTEQPEKSVFWVSPPSNSDGFGNYGFLFLFLRDGARVNEYILRYNEQKGSIDRSIDIHQSINNFSENGIWQKQPLSTPLQDEKEALANPVSLSLEISEIGNLLTKIGFNGDYIRDSHDFERQITENSEITAFMKEYGKTVLNASYLDKGTEQYNLHLLKAKHILTAIYYKAREIKDESYIRENINPNSRENISQRIACYAHTPAYVEDGGSCPTVKKSLSYALSKTSPIERALHKFSPDDEDEDSFPCPNPKCKKPIPKGKGITECPHCHITKEQYAKESGVSCG